MSGLDHPAARPPIGVVRLELDLLAAAADVGLEALGDGERAALVEVVAAIQAKALRLLGVWYRPGDRNRLQGRLQELYVMAVGTLVRDPDRDAGSLDEERALRPLLALSVGLGPVFGPPSGALVIAPSAASQDQSIPICAS